MTGKKIMVIGANGQLGQDLQRALSVAGDDCIPLTHADIEVDDAARVFAAVRRHRPDTVINTAAYHRVDEVQSNPERAFAVNAIGPLHLARACQEQGAVLVHLSTDYVFAGDLNRPYTERDTPRPLSVYGVSKLAGEYLVRATLPAHCIIRTSGLYGMAGSRARGGNFVETMVRIGRERGEVRVVADQIASTTNTADLAGKIVELVHAGARGIFHVANTGHCSWYEFACAIFRCADMDVNVKPITAVEYGAAAPRPRFSALDSERLAEVGLDPMPPWEDALGRYLACRRNAAER